MVWAAKIFVLSGLYFLLNLLELCLISICKCVLNRCMVDANLCTLSVMHRCMLGAKLGPVSVYVGNVFAYFVVMTLMTTCCHNYCIYTHVLRNRVQESFIDPFYYSYFFLVDDVFANVKICPSHEKCKFNFVWL